MADSEPRTTDRPAVEDRPLQQPAGAVQMEDMAKEDEMQTKLEGGASIPAPGNDADRITESPIRELEPAATADSVEGRSKGKGKAVVQPQPHPDDDLSIGPTDPLPEVSASSPEHPVCNITLLLPTGARHPYKIDEKYLTKRNVGMPDLTPAGKKDPFSISVYTLKELILREWRDDWENKPTSPSSIRLIHFGKLFDDKEQLKKYNFSTELPNVVHMSVRPADMVEEDEAAKGKSAGRDGHARRNTNRCCVIL